MVFFVVFITTIIYIFAKTLGYGLSLVGAALILSGIMSLGSYYFSDKMVLAISGAKEIKKEDNRQLYNTVENLCIASGQPIPKIYIISDSSPNAFATGRSPDKAVVCVTSGLLNMLAKTELEGVISHELSHIKNFDIRLMAVVAILVGFIALISDIFMRSLWFGGSRDNERNSAQGVLMVIGIIFAILSPIVAILIQLAVSRKREFLADASGVLLTRFPEGLTSALIKISKYPYPLKNANNATAHLFISNPFKNKESKNPFSSLFNTHPPIEERIKILRSM
ncbi:MAG: zinc metalloprotease HtpX [Candidatus Levybacteria bacterium RIFCSPLOWO2_01_FULL_38_13]|nr:MAG: zinc metalloprotease HtpX [Candidatus Levybacteria bacterium RIFCSPHIGHO2_01_FULL_41_15]OGH35353.1 MAG: zinc metalloprotease HtpX [Candidatus Levybacteria bacterium RIFCSPLOWO2_01_FULL_38_13]